MKSTLSSIFLTRRFLLLIVGLAALAYQIGTFGQSPSVVQATSIDVNLCPPLAMCIVDPETGRCMSIPCPFATPTPGQSPTPTPSPVCLQLDTIDSCIKGPDGGCVTIRKPCINPPDVGPDAPIVPLIISEFRFRGPGGANDEFVELFNKSSSPVTVNVTDGSAGWALVASDGIVRFTVPAGTVIPGFGHYLGVNSAGYSLGSYPADENTTATGDTSYVIDIPDHAGIALFNTANPASFTMANRLDAVGYNTTTALYREGNGFPGGSAETLFNIQYSFYRDLTSGSPRDTNDNQADFRGVDVNAANTGAGQFLGAPGPENLSSPVMVGSTKIQVALIDPATDPSLPPNRVRDATSDPGNNSPYGTLSIRRMFTNVSNQPITRLRFRIVDITSYPYVSGTSDIRAINSGSVVATRSDGINVFVRGTTLETPPAQINGGAWNSTMNANNVTLASPLYPNQSANFQFMLGVQQSGYFRFFIVVEAL
jgi:hypothetical protein